MADYLASIYGTEKDKVNCSFYFKIGACRHGDRCSRKHVKPTFSQTVLINNVYNNPSHDPTITMTPEQLQEHFELFWEDFFIELAKYGEVEEMHVCDNVGDHLVGNVYVRYRIEEDAEKAAEGLSNRFYAGRPLYAELSPVTDFREACCRQHENGECNRGGFCNFMHLKRISGNLRRELFESQRAMLRELRRERDQEQRGLLRRNEEREHEQHRNGRGRDRERTRSKSMDQEKPRIKDEIYIDTRHRGGFEDEHRPERDMTAYAESNGVNY